MVNLLDRNVAARRLGISVSTLDRRVRGGDLPAVRDGRRVLFRTDDLDAYIVDRKA